MKNKKGFTLIELLAVIIILGLLMLIAIPSVTKYIADSRKKTYIDTAKELVAGARALVNSGNLDMYDTDTTYYIPYSCINTENGARSPFGDFDKAYVLVTYDEKGFNYYWMSRDETGQGVIEPVSVDELNDSLIKSNIAADTFKPNITKDGTSLIKILKSDCAEFKEDNAAGTVSDKDETVNIAGADRYVGRNPSNYVFYNEELWRIIGSYDNKIKIIRNSNLGNRKLNTYLDPTWSTSTLKNYLVNTYFPSMTQTAQDMVEQNSTWYVGKSDNDIVAARAYSDEIRETWVGKIGLLNLYEYLYAAPESCHNTSGDFYFPTCAGQDWLRLSSSDDMWLMSRDYTNVAGLLVTNQGRAFGNPAWCEYGVFPVVYLKSSVKITGGKGTKTEPYTLGY